MSLCPWKSISERLSQKDLHFPTMPQWQREQLCHTLNFYLRQVTLHWLQKGKNKSTCELQCSLFYEKTSRTHFIHRCIHIHTTNHNLFPKVSAEALVWEFFILQPVSFQKQFIQKRHWKKARKNEIALPSPKPPKMPRKGARKTWGKGDLAAILKRDLFLLQATETNRQQKQMTKNYSMNVIQKRGKNSCWEASQFFSL